MVCSTPGFPVLHYPWEFAQIMSIESVMLSNYLIFCYLLLLLPSIFPSIRVFSNESAHHIRWPKTIRRPCSLVTQSCSTLCNPVDCSPPGSSVLGDSPGKNSGVSCHALLQGIFLTQGLNLHLLCLLCCRWVLHPLSDWGSPHTHAHAHTHTHRLLHILFHYRLLQDTKYSFLCYTVGPCWLSIFCIVIVWPPHARS